MLAISAGLAILGCGAQDSQSPSQTTPPGVVSLVPGQSAVVNGATTLQVDGGAQGTENVLVIADTATVSVSAKSSYSVTATSVTAAGTISAPATALIPETGGSGGSSALASGPLLDMSFGMRLNERNRGRLVGGFRAARAAHAARSTAPVGPSRSVTGIAPQVGDLVQVNVGSRACDSLVTRAARIVAIGSKSIVLADTLNPSGGFSAADYQRFAARFDTLVYPLDVTNFGEPADIDQNGKIELLFTSAVNELTPRNSTSYVGGFFFDRDLFPVSSTPDFQGCLGSNVGELFYLLAPDPTGTVNGNIRRTGFV
ncbi:MAG: Peptidase hyicolysin, partial [Gemmatimonadetes bacterium]|nr:Peptidase hyicolysin [Gemmatimonadota bacterium]